MAIKAKHPKLSLKEIMVLASKSYSGKGKDEENELKKYLPKDVVNHVVKGYIDAPSKKELIALDNQVKDLYADVIMKLNQQNLSKKVLNQKIHMLEKYLIYGNKNVIFNKLSSAKAIEYYDKLKLARSVLKNLVKVKFF